MPIIGIDLGTTNSLVSCFRDGKCELLANVYGENLTPSVVSFLDNGEIIIGQAAKERLYTHPHMTASAFKRFIGSKKQYHLGAQTLSPVELSSLVLGALKADAEKALGMPVYEAVVSVPAYFNDQQRRATKQAGELIGLKIERLISEPTAAALAYGLHENEKESQFMVFDMGGGTFDVSIVEMFDDVLEVKAVAGNNFFGGKDFDDAIAAYFIKQLDLQRLVDEKVLSMIKEKAEEAKCALSSQAKVQMRVVIKDKPYILNLTESILEKVFEPLLAQIRQPIVRALHDAKIKPANLSHVVMVGGASQMPLVRAHVARLFQKFPLVHIDPNEAVGIGVGIYAAMKARSAELGEKLMTDVCPYTLGTAIADTDMYTGKWTNDVFMPIIERNTAIPYSKVVRLYTIRDNQDTVDLKIYQGESRQASQNLQLGKLTIDVPKKPSGQAAIDVRYTYDINGILEVEVTGVDTGKKRREVILNIENQMNEAEIEAALERLASLKIHPREQSENRLLIARGERLYEESLGHARDSIGQWLMLFEAVLDEQNPQIIKDRAADFAMFLGEMERQY